MERVCAIVKEHCEIIQQVISEEAEHWKDIHAVMNQYEFKFIFPAFFCYFD